MVLLFKKLTELYIVPIPKPIAKTFFDEHLEFKFIMDLSYYWFDR